MRIPDVKTLVAKAQSPHSPSILLIPFGKSTDGALKKMPSEDFSSRSQAVWQRADWGGQRLRRRLSKTKINILSVPKSYLVAGGGLVRLLDLIHEVIGSGRREVNSPSSMAGRASVHCGWALRTVNKSKILGWAVARNILSTHRGENGERGPPPASRGAGLCTRPAPSGSRALQASPTRSSSSHHSNPQVVPEHLSCAQHCAGVGVGRLAEVGG